MAEQKPGSNRIYYWLVGIAIGMFGFGFALVPLYNVMCKQLGINGKTSGVATVNYGKVDESRTITIQFLATRNSQMPWVFHPKQRSVRIHPGQNKRIAFYAENTTNKTMTVQAIPSVSPSLAAKYLKKTECFCFTQQTMKAHEGMDWPILFHIDNDLPKNIRTVTLAYTLFDLSQAPVKQQPKQTPGKIY